MSSKKPLIGVSIGFHDYGDYVAVGFQRPIAAAGGVPVILLRVPGTLNDLLDRCDGIVLTGGRDIRPENYGRVPSDGMGRTDQLRDAFELDLATEALRRGMPLLGFCRGMQLLNVVRGGTLVQDVRSVPDWSEHPSDPDLVAWHAIVAASLEGRLPGAYPNHPISIEPGSLLHRLVGLTDVNVTSLHHQAVDAVGDGLRVTAHAPDGVPEAIEGRPDAFGGNQFVLGVQFELHEDARLTPAFEGVFARFISAARDRHSDLA
jgi:putative glutamine amidotransferase